MNKKQNAKLTMYYTVINYCKENLAVIKSIPALQMAYTQFLTAVSNIGETEKQRLYDLSGVAEDKLKARQALLLLAVKLAAKIFAYAESIGNNKLKGRMKFKLSDFQKFKNEELPNVLRDIVDMATQHLAALADYNVTAATIKAFADKIDEYELLATTPRNEANQRISNTSSLKDLFIIADNILKNQLDKIIEEFRDVNAAFYNTYVVNRFIIDPPTTTTQIKGVITNNVTDKPIHNATIVVVENGLTKKTNLKGEYAIKPLTHDTYTVEVSAEGFKTKRIAGNVVKYGRIKRVSVSLSPTTDERDV